MAQITKRNNSYRIRISLGYDSENKQIIRSMTYKPTLGMTPKQIEKELQRQVVLFEEKVKAGYNPSHLTFKEFTEKWFVDYADLKLKKTTISQYQSIKIRVYKNIGHIPIDKISPTDIQSFVGSMIRENLSTGTIKNLIRFISGVLGYAIKKRLIDYNPCLTVDYPKENKNKKNILTLDEAKLFLCKLQEHNRERDMPYIAFFILVMYTGARRSELLALTWDDIDFEEKTLSINKGYHYSRYHKESYIDTTKTKRSERIIKISDVPIKALEDLYEWHEEQKKIFGSIREETKNLFTQQNGKAFHTNSPYRWVLNFFEKNELRRVDIHSFRHLTASILINQGVDVISVQSILGHSTAVITLNTYGHAFATAQAETAVALSKALDN